MKIIITGILMILSFLAYGQEYDEVTLKTGVTLVGKLKDAERYGYYVMESYWKGKMIAKQTIHQQDIKKKRKVMVADPKPKVKVDVPKKGPFDADKLSQLAQARTKEQQEILKHKENVRTITARMSLMLSEAYDKWFKANKSQFLLAETIKYRKDHKFKSLLRYLNDYNNSFKRRDLNFHFSLTHIRKAMKTKTVDEDAVGTIDWVTYDTIIGAAKTHQCEIKFTKSD